MHFLYLRTFYISFFFFNVIWQNIEQNLGQELSAFSKFCFVLKIKSFEEKEEKEKAYTLCVHVCVCVW